jgi:hypothetical protein
VSGGDGRCARGAFRVRKTLSPGLFASRRFHWCQRPPPVSLASLASLSSPARRFATCGGGVSLARRMLLVVEGSGDLDLRSSLDHDSTYGAITRALDDMKTVVARGQPLSRERSEAGESTIERERDRRWGAVESSWRVGEVPDQLTEPYDFEERCHQVSSPRDGSIGVHRPLRLARCAREPPPPRRFAPPGRSRVVRASVQVAVGVRRAFLLSASSIQSIKSIRSIPAPRRAKRAISL